MGLVQSATSLKWKNHRKKIRECILVIAKYILSSPFLFKTGSTISQEGLLLRIEAGNDMSQASFCWCNVSVALFLPEFKNIHFTISGESFNNQPILSNDSPIEIVKSDEETPLSPMESNQQPRMISKEGPRTEAEIFNEEDQELAEHAKLNIIDTLHNLDMTDHDQQPAIESFLQEDVSTYHTRFNNDYLKK